MPWVTALKRQKKTKDQDVKSFNVDHIGVQERMVFPSENNI